VLQVLVNNIFIYFSDLHNAGPDDFQNLVIFSLSKDTITFGKILVKIRLVVFLREVANRQTNFI